MALGYAVGRVGCFLVGDDYGVPTSLPWGVRFPVGLPPTDAGSLRAQFGISIPADVPSDELLAVHPTQLYELFGLLLLFVGLRWASRRSLKAGGVFALYLIGYGLLRFCVDFFRGDQDWFFLGLVLSQWISLGALALGLFILFSWVRRSS